MSTYTVALDTDAIKCGEKESRGMFVQNAALTALTTKVNHRSLLFGFLFANAWRRYFHYNSFATF